VLTGIGSFLVQAETAQKADIALVLAGDGLDCDAKLGLVQRAGDGVLGIDGGVALLRRAKFTCPRHEEPHQ